MNIDKELQGGRIAGLFMELSLLYCVSPQWGPQEISRSILIDTSPVLSSGELVYYGIPEELVSVHYIFNEVYLFKNTQTET